MYVKQHSYELLFYNVELRLDGILFDYYSGILFNYYLQNNKEQLRTLNTTKALKMRALVIVYPNCSKLLIISYLPTQEL